MILVVEDDERIAALLMQLASPHFFRRRHSTF